MAAKTYVLCTGPKTVVSPAGLCSADVTQRYGGEGATEGLPETRATTTNTDGQRRYVTFLKHESDLANQRSRLQEMRTAERREEIVKSDLVRQV